MSAILDIDYEQIDRPATADAARCLVRFWWRGWPIGQGEDVGAAGRRLALHDLAARVVAADVLAYALAGVMRDAPAGTPVDASIVICTRDRPEALARCLASLAEQTARPIEVIVVDNASREASTREVVLAAGMTYVREDRPGLDIARNTGARAARGAIVAYTDDDVALHPRWLERMVRAFDAPSVGAVTGLVLPGELETRAQRLFETHWGFARGFRRIDFGPDFFARDQADGCPSWEIGAGASMAFRRELFDTVGWFDERLDVGAAGCSGDSEYWHRLLAHGQVCRYEPGAAAFHYHRREMAGLSHQIYHYLRGHAAALLVQYERTGNRGNLLRLLGVMPAWFGARALRRLVRRRSDADWFLRQEIGGYLAGILFYLRHRRRH